MCFCSQDVRIHASTPGATTLLCIDTRTRVSTHTTVKGFTCHDAAAIDELLNECDSGSSSTSNWPARKGSPCRCVFRIHLSSSHPSPPPPYASLPPFAYFRLSSDCLHIIFQWLFATIVTAPADKYILQSLTAHPYIIYVIRRYVNIFFDATFTRHRAQFYSFYSFVCWLCVCFCDVSPSNAMLLLRRQRLHPIIHERSAGECGYASLPRHQCARPTSPNSQQLIITIILCRQCMVWCVISLRRRRRRRRHISPAIVIVAHFNNFFPVLFRRRHRPSVTMETPKIWQHAPLFFCAAHACSPSCKLGINYKIQLKPCFWRARLTFIASTAAF